MSGELKPCPFCAGKPYAQENGRMGFRYWEVVCDNECDFTGPAKDTKEQAVEAWNRRDPEAAKDAEIKALRSELTKAKAALHEVRIEAFQREPVPKPDAVKNSIRGSALALSGRLGGIEQMCRSALKGDAA